MQKVKIRWTCPDNARSLSADGVGRHVYRGPHKRHLAAAHLLPAEPSLSPVLPAQRWPLQGQVHCRHGLRGQTGVADCQGTAHQPTQPGGALNDPLKALHYLSRVQWSGTTSAVLTVTLINWVNVKEVLRTAEFPIFFFSLSNLKCGEQIRQNGEKAPETLITGVITFLGVIVHRWNCHFHDVQVQTAWMTRSTLTSGQMTRLCCEWLNYRQCKVYRGRKQDLIWEMNYRLGERYGVAGFSWGTRPQFPRDRGIFKIFFKLSFSHWH